MSRQCVTLGGGRRGSLSRVEIVAARHAASCSADPLICERPVPAQCRRYDELGCPLGQRLEIDVALALEPPHERRRTAPLRAPFFVFEMRNVPSTLSFRGTSIASDA